MYYDVLLTRSFYSRICFMLLMKIGSIMFMITQAGTLQYGLSVSSLEHVSKSFTSINRFYTYEIVHLCGNGVVKYIKSVLLEMF